MAKKSEKKSGGGGAVAGVAILCLLLGGGAGFGYGTGFFGNNNNNSQNSGTEENVPAAEIITENITESEISDTETEETPQETEISVIDITVSGNVILQDGNEISVDDIIKEAKELGGSVMVDIKDDNAIADTMDELKEKLDSENISCEIN